MIDAYRPPSRLKIWCWDWIPLIVFVAMPAVCAAQVACTAAQKADAKTALTVTQCVNTIVLAHLDEDLKDPVQLAALASEIAATCGPELQKAH